MNFEKGVIYKIGGPRSDYDYTLAMFLKMTKDNKSPVFIILGFHPTLVHTRYKYLVGKIRVFNPEYFYEKFNLS
jgi:hypothetical protein